MAIETQPVPASVRTPGKQQALFILIEEGQPIDWNKTPFPTQANQFTPWLHDSNEATDMTLGLAVHRHLRNRGGFGDEDKLDFHLHYYGSGVAKHPNGIPKVIHYAHYVLTRTD